MGGLDGFLGSRASFMLDVVAIAMLLVVPVLVTSIYLVRYRRLYALHKVIQLSTAAILLVALVLFEVDVRLNGWRHRAMDSAYSGADGGTDWVSISLAIHLCFAISTTVLWTVVIVQALRKFPSPPVPNGHSAWHKRYARLAALDMCCTAITGWLFYWLAFVA